MKARSRRAILESALHLFAEKGYSAATTDEIAARAGVSKGLVFTHFPTKKAILLAIYDDELVRLLPAPDMLADTRAPREKFVSLVDSWMKLLKDEPAIVRLSLQLNLDPGYKEILQNEGKHYLELYLDRMRSLLEHLGSKTPDLDAFLLGVLFDGITANYFVAPDLFPLEAIKDHLIQMMLASWEGSPAR